MKKLLLISLVAVIGLFAVSSFMRSCNDLDETAHKELDASALLKKYQYFKELSGSIDKFRADIDMYRTELSDMKVVDKDDKFYYQQRKSELIGIIAEHNNLCAKYNTLMSEANYRFSNVGDLPATNLTPLPREYKPYINNIK